MELIIQSYASYNSQKGALTVAGFLMYFGDAAVALQLEGTPTSENGAIMYDIIVIDVVITSAGEGEYIAGCIAAQLSVKNFLH